MTVDVGTRRLIVKINEELTMRTDEGLTVKVNGTDIFLREPLSLADFLLEQQYNPNYVAVEVNGEVVSRAAYEQMILSDGDVLEIVRFVGGG